MNIIILPSGRAIPTRQIVSDVAPGVGRCNRRPCFLPRFSPYAEGRLPLPGKDAVLAVHPFLHACLKGVESLRRSGCLIIVPGLCGRLGRPTRRCGKSARGFPLVLFRPRPDIHKGIVRTGRQPRPRRIARLTAVCREGTARAFPASADMNKEYRSSPAQAFLEGADLSFFCLGGCAMFSAGKE